MVRTIHRNSEQDPRLGSSAPRQSSSWDNDNNRGNDYLSQFPAQGGSTNLLNSSHTRLPSSLPPSSDDSFLNRIPSSVRLQAKESLSQGNSLSVVDPSRINWVEVEGGMTKEQVMVIFSMMEGIGDLHYGKGR